VQKRTKLFLIRNSKWYHSDRTDITNNRSRYNYI